jgi:hydroxymethylpyrimidine pyrophosphatase-like HAD family hydrolase/energy-coupling factor transporter ATP-binding protein EcfA2
VSTPQGKSGRPLPAHGSHGVRHVALAVDYDGTLAAHGVVADDVVTALERLKKTGRKLVLVTGREVEDVLRIFPRVDLFDRVVGENGAVGYGPADRRLEIHGEPPPAVFVEALRDRGVTPLSVGHVIVATWEPNQSVVLEVIRDLGLELQVIFNKGAVMVLPAGTNKATGLEQALASLHVSPHNAVGIGDAENDHAFLNLCETAVAVPNAVPTLRERADWVTPAPRGAGVIDLIQRLSGSTLEEVAPAARRHRLVLGDREDGTPLTVPAHGSTVLIGGASGSGKSTIATAILEQLIEQRYQFCLVDPEGDYSDFAPAIMLGRPETAPTIDEVFDLLRKPDESIIALLLGQPVEDRPQFLRTLLGRMPSFLAETGRPHWLVLDEAHHLLSEDVNAPQSLPAELDSTMLVTAHPNQLPRSVLSDVNTVIAVGPNALEVFGSVASGVGPAALVAGHAADHGEALIWFPHEEVAPARFRPAPPRGDRQRHRRKYAEGTLGPDKSFYFRGPDGALRLRAQNLGMFLQMADGVDDDTWTYHLRRGDYSTWVREAIKDAELADEISAIERLEAPSAERSKSAIAEAIGRRYTAPS